MGEGKRAGWKASDLEFYPVSVSVSLTCAQREGWKTLSAWQLTTDSLSIQCQGTETCSDLRTLDGGAPEEGGVVTELTESSRLRQEGTGG